MIHATVSEFTHRFKQYQNTIAVEPAEVVVVTNGRTQEPVAVVLNPVHYADLVERVTIAELEHDSYSMYYDEYDDATLALTYEALQ